MGRGPTDAGRRRDVPWQWPWRAPRDGPPSPREHPEVPRPARRAALLRLTRCRDWEDTTLLTSQTSRRAALWRRDVRPPCVLSGEPACSSVPCPGMARGRRVVVIRRRAGARTRPSDSPNRNLGSRTCPLHRGGRSARIARFCAAPSSGPRLRAGRTGPSTKCWKQDLLSRRACNLGAPDGRTAPRRSVGSSRAREAAPPRSDARGPVVLALSTTRSVAADQSTAAADQTQRPRIAEPPRPATAVVPAPRLLPATPRGPLPALRSRARRGRHPHVALARRRMGG
jgi:hypothetical protein